MGYYAFALITTIFTMMGLDWLTGGAVSGDNASANPYSWHGQLMFLLFVAIWMGESVALRSVFNRPLPQ